MEITLKNYEIINAYNSASELMKVKNLPIKASWNITKNIKTIELIFQSFVTLEQNLIKEYAIKDDNGNIKSDDNNQPKFPPHSEYFTKHAELVACENVLDILTVKLSDLEKCDISPSILYNFTFMIDDAE
jgi:hypothetical protein